MTTSASGGAGSGGGPREGEGESALKQADSVTGAGYWPTWRAKIANDFRSSKAAKANDGLNAPQFATPDWDASAGAGTQAFLDAAQRRHDKAEARIANAEGRATRLIQFALSLLTIAFLASGFQAARLRSSHSPLWVWLIAGLLAAGAITCLVMAAIQAVGVDRVGFVQPADPALAANIDTETSQRANLAAQEYLAFQMANWTGRHKTNEVLQARAWLTRGLALLLASGLCAISIWAFVDPVAASPQLGGCRARERDELHGVGTEPGRKCTYRVRTLSEERR